MALWHTTDMIRSTDCEPHLLTLNFLMQLDIRRQSPRNLFLAKFLKQPSWNQLQTLCRFYPQALLLSYRNLVSFVLLSASLPLAPLSFFDVPNQCFPP